jgi:hypothetical protein
MMVDGSRPASHQKLVGRPRGPERQQGGNKSYEKSAGSKSQRIEECSPLPNETKRGRGEQERAWLRAEKS